MGEGAMPVAEVMTRKVITAKRSTTLKELMEIFRRFSLRTLPVVDRENKVIGMVALEDVLKMFQPYPSNILDMLDRVPFLDEYDDISLWDVDIPSEMGVLCVVEDLMNMNVVTINEEATTIQARSLMKLHRLKRIPVVDEENHLLGIISLFDIIMAVFKQK
ncbi:CBS domain-containing protein, partial [Candidatus Aerophobetes bacterium]